MKKQTQCYIYVRVSTAIQVDGYSLDVQKEKLRNYAAFQDMTIFGQKHRCNISIERCIVSFFIR